MIDIIIDEEYEDINVINYSNILLKFDLKFLKFFIFRLCLSSRANYDFKILADRVLDRFDRLAIKNGFEHNNLQNFEKFSMYVC